MPYGQNGETHCYFEMLTENKNLRDFLPIGRKTEKTALKCFHSENKNVSRIKISVVVKQCFQYIHANDTTIYYLISYLEGLTNIFLFYCI